MTTDEMKELVIWLRNNGVQQCAFNGLSVSFVSRAIRTGDALHVTQRADIREEPKRDEVMFDG